MLKLFQAIMQDYQQGFEAASTRSDRVFILWGQFIKFFYCLLRRVVSKVPLPTEVDWEVNQNFDFTLSIEKVCWVSAQDSISKCCAPS